MSASKSDRLTDRRPKFAAVYHFAIGKLTPIAMACYVVLCKHSDNDKHDAWPGHAKIAAIAKMSRSSVKRALSELVKQKLISIRKIGRKGQEHNHYTLLFPASTQANKGGMVPTEPRFSPNRGRSSRNRGRSSQSPELDSVNLDSVNLDLKNKTGAAHDDSASRKRKANSSNNPQRVEKLSASSKSKPDSAPPRDERFDSFRAHLDEGHAKHSYTLTARDGKELKDFLEQQPKWDVTKFKKAVHNYFASDGTSPTSPPHIYLKKLPLYLASPLDKYKNADSSRSPVDIGETLGEKMKREMAECQRKAAECRRSRNPADVRRLEEQALECKSTAQQQSRDACGLVEECA